ncbi:MAG TPA: D-alanyl-D-alanine carboxypeptidase family protein [Acidimicrobiales bacterium]|nr:D-alanyl-D-alanine carboxypeptidase family protein [Acidimicrobiales bacterium]
MPSPSFRSLTRGVLAVVAATTMVVVPVLVQAEESDDPRAERDRVREQAADVAAQLDGLQADAQEVGDALRALADNVQSKRAQFQDAQRAAATALAEARAARAEEQRLQDQIADLEDQVAQIAVEAYIRPPESNDAAVYETSDINDTTLRAALLGTQSNRQEDVIDQLRAAEDDLSAQRVAAEAAAQEARALRGQTRTQLLELRAAQNQQRELARQVDERINQAAGEAAALAERDEELSDQIAEEAAQFASFIQGLNLGPVGPSYQSGPVSVADAGNGIIVNVAIVDQVHNMIVAAANDGVTLTGGGYRDSAQQIALRRAHCGSSDYAIYQAPSSSCSPPTAIPGTSMHEQGLAIDFDNCSYGTSVYNWLSGHAAGYGLYNLPSESWHWSTTGG